MASEGELKKRIREEIINTSRRLDGLRCDSLTGATKQPYESVTVYQRYFDFKKEDPFQKILGEAAKEFWAVASNVQMYDEVKAEKFEALVKKWFGVP